MIVCIVQARITSSRLPGKVMYSLAGEPAINHVLKRCQKIKGVGRVVVAAPDDVRSTVIADAARSMGVDTFYGPENDVLKRYFLTAANTRAKIIVRVTADCPLLDPEKCEEVIELLDEADYSSNVSPRSVVKGHDCEAFTMQALTRAHREAVDPHDREHVTPHIQKHMKTVAARGEYDPKINYCLDTPADYLRLKAMFE